MVMSYFLYVAFAFAIELISFLFSDANETLFNVIYE